VKFLLSALVLCEILSNETDLSNSYKFTFWDQGTDFQKKSEDLS